MKDMPYKVSVEELRASPHYGNLVARIQSLAPVIPPFDHKGATNIETIKFRLAQRSMHELVMSFLKGEAK